MQATVQLSLDFTDLQDALEAAEVASRAGVDWLEAGTPLLLSEGARAVRELRARYADTPIVADLKMMDGAYQETEMMARAGANMVVVMGQAHSETVELAVKAGRDFGMKIMGDDMNMPDPVRGAEQLEDLGCDYLVHHIGYDWRTLRRARSLPSVTPLERLREIVKAVRIPVQAVGGLSVEEAMMTPTLGAPMVVIGAPLVSVHSLRASKGDLESMLRSICEKVHSFGEVTNSRNRLDG